MKNNLSRRHFLQMAALGTGSLLLLPRCVGQKGSGGWRFLTTSEVPTLEALVEQIIPTDEWPGARDAGVVRFMDKQLAGPYVRYQETYRLGLEAINTTSVESYGKPFEQLSWEQQTQFLQNMESGQMNNASPGSKSEALWTEGLDREFFNLLREHTMQGFYGSPRHGGNKNHLSYKMVGLDYPLIIGQNRYNKKS